MNTDDARPKQKIEEIVARTKKINHLRVTAIKGHLVNRSALETEVIRYGPISRGLSIEQTAEGMNAARRNSSRLAEDARLLLEAGRQAAIRSVCP